MCRRRITMQSDGERVLEMIANDLLHLDKLAEMEREMYYDKFDNDIDLSESDIAAIGIDSLRFKTVTSEDCTEFVRENQNKNTTTKTKSDIKIFDDWKKSINEQRDLTDIPPQELDNLLARFFLAIRKRDGSEYEPGTHTSIQYSIDRYLKEKRAGFSVIKDATFSHSNHVLSSKRKNLKGQGKGNLKAKAEPLTKDEIQSLRGKGLLGKGDPETLLQTVWLNNGVYFGMRGRQDHTNLLWGDIELKTSPDKREYLEFTERSTKTRDGSKRNSYREVSPKLFAKPEDDMCPVEIYKEYRRHRPRDLLDENSRFYLQPLNAPKTDVWYSHQPVGKNKLGKIMNILAEKGQLQGRKVNHSTRKTFAQTLVHGGRPPTEVAHLGGWKSLQTINNYSTPSLEQQAKASDIISSVMLPSVSSKESSESSVKVVSGSSQCYVRHNSCL